jgi:dolichol-phosphate mannosyltransferase
MTTLGILAPVPPEVSIVVPLFNEEENVRPLVAELDRIFSATRRSWELVLVDDGSVDGTWREVLRAQMENRCVRGLRHERNAGQSAAVWTGIAGSEAGLICTLDGDLQNDPDDLPKMLDMLSNVDFVAGRRRHRRDTWLRRISSLVARRVRSWALNSDLADTGCALRAFRRSSLHGVFPFNGLHRFLPILVAGNGSRVIEVPVGHRPRVAGRSKYGVWNRLGRGIWDLASMAWYQRRRLPPIRVEDSRQAKAE